MNTPTRNSSPQSLSAPFCGTVTLVFAICCALAACNLTNTVRPIRGSDGAIASVGQSAPNWWLDSKATVVDARESIVSGDTKRVQVSIYSSQMQQQRFSYRFEWYDRSGMRVAGMDSWKSLMILPKQTLTVDATAPSPTVTNWMLQISDTNYPLDSTSP